MLEGRKTSVVLEDLRASAGGNKNIWNVKT